MSDPKDTKKGGSEEGQGIEWLLQQAEMLRRNTDTTGLLMLRDPATIEGEAVRLAKVARLADTGGLPQYPDDDQDLAMAVSAMRLPQSGTASTVHAAAAATTRPSEHSSMLFHSGLALTTPRSPARPSTHNVIGFSSSSSSAFFDGDDDPSGSSIFTNSSSGSVCERGLFDCCDDDEFDEYEDEYDDVFDSENGGENEEDKEYDEEESKDVDEFGHPRRHRRRAVRGAEGADRCVWRRAVRAAGEDGVAALEGDVWAWVATEHRAGVRAVRPARDDALAYPSCVSCSTLVDASPAARSAALADAARARLALEPPAVAEMHAEHVAMYAAGVAECLTAAEEETGQMEEQKKEEEEHSAVAARLAEYFLRKLDRQPDALRSIQREAWRTVRAIALEASAAAAGAQGPISNRNVAMACAENGVRRALQLHYASTLWGDLCEHAEGAAGGDLQRCVSAGAVAAYADLSAFARVVAARVAVRAPAWGLVERGADGVQPWACLYCALRGGFSELAHLVATSLAAAAPECAFVREWVDAVVPAPSASATPDAATSTRLQRQAASLLPHLARAHRPDPFRLAVCALVAGSLDPLDAFPAVLSSTRDVHWHYLACLRTAPALGTPGARDARRRLARRCADALRRRRAAAAASASASSSSSSSSNRGGVRRSLSPNVRRGASASEGVTATGAEEEDADMDEFLGLLLGLQFSAALRALWEDEGPFARIEAVHFGLALQALGVLPHRDAGVVPPSAATALLGDVFVAAPAADRAEQMHTLRVNYPLMLSHYLQQHILVAGEEDAVVVDGDESSTTPIPLPLERAVQYVRLLRAPDDVIAALLSAVILAAVARGIAAPEQCHASVTAHFAGARGDALWRHAATDAAAQCTAPSLARARADLATLAGESPQSVAQTLASALLPVAAQPEAAALASAARALVAPAPTDAAPALLHALEIAEFHAAARAAAAAPPGERVAGALRAAECLVGPHGTVTLPTDAPALAPALPHVAAALAALARCVCGAYALLAHGAPAPEDAAAHLRAVAEALLRYARDTDPAVREIDPAFPPFSQIVEGHLAFLRSTSSLPISPLQ